MKRFRLIPMVAALSMAAISVSAAAAPSLEERVKRLERMVENPVMFQMSELLAEQQREIQSLQDRLDRLEYRYRKQFLRQQAQLDSLMKRLDALEKALREKGLIPEALAVEEDSLIPPEEAAGEEDAVQPADDAIGAAVDRETKSGEGDQAEDQKTVNAAASPRDSVSGESVVPPPPVQSEAEKDASTGAAAEEDSASDEKVDGRPGQEESVTTVGPLKPATSAQERQYRQAMLKLRQYRYEEAAEALDAFVEAQPDVTLAPAALYWAGEAYMVQSRPDAAWQRFNRIIQAYPESSRLPDALYRGAEALRQLDRREEAIGLLKRLLQDYPGHPLTPRAQALLERLTLDEAPVLDEEAPISGIDVTGREGTTVGPEGNAEAADER